MTRTDGVGRVVPDPDHETGPDVDAQLAGVALEQALRDFEVANARVTDLTQRLIEANDQLIELKAKAAALESDNVSLREENEAVRVENDTIKASLAFKLLLVLRGARDALKR
jgi:hypothetical protein